MSVAIVGALILPPTLLGLYAIGSSMLGGRWRRTIPIGAPLLLGVACMVATSAILVQAGRPPASLLGSFEGVSFVVALTSGLIGGVGAFFAEKTISRRAKQMKARRAAAVESGLPLSLRMLAPGADESMTAVQGVAANRPLFLLLTIWTVLGEEILYRGAVVLVGFVFGADLAALVLIQALFYGANHLGFGLSAMLGKFLFGLVLGAITVLSGNIFAGVLIHFFYQHMVWHLLAKQTLPLSSRQEV